MPPGLFTRGLARQELEREFESHSLRHLVWNAEKSAEFTRENPAKSRPIRSFPLSKRTRENVEL